MRRYGDAYLRKLHFRERLPYQLLGSDASYAPPPRFEETAVWLSVELDDVEALRKLPPVRVGVVHSPVGVVLDHNWRCGRFLQELPGQSCQHLDSIRHRRSGILVKFGENGDGWSRFLWLVEPQIADRLYAVIPLVVPGAIVNDLGRFGFFQATTNLSFTE